MDHAAARSDLRDAETSCFASSRRRQRVTIDAADGCGANEALCPRQEPQTTGRILKYAGRRRRTRRLLPSKLSRVRAVMMYY